MENSIKKDNFKRLAQIRTDAVLDKIRILGNCSNRSAYQYSDEEVAKIFSAIDDQLKIVKSKFKHTKRKFKF